MFGLLLIFKYLDSSECNRMADYIFYASLVHCVYLSVLERYWSSVLELFVFWVDVFSYFNVDRPSWASSFRFGDFSCSLYSLDEVVFTVIDSKVVGASMLSHRVYFLFRLTYVFRRRRTAKCAWSLVDNNNTLLCILQLSCY